MAHPLQIILLAAACFSLSVSINPSSGQANAFSVSELFNRPRLFQRSQQPQVATSSAAAGAQRQPLATGTATNFANNQNNNNNNLMVAQSKLAQASTQAQPSGLSTINNEQRMHLMAANQALTFGRAQGNPEDLLRFASSRNIVHGSNSNFPRPQPNQFHLVPSPNSDLNQQQTFQPMNGQATMGLPGSLAISARPILIQQGVPSGEQAVSQSEIVDKIEQHIGQKIEQSLAADKDPHAFLMSAAAYHHKQPNQHQQQQSAGQLAAATGHAESESSEYESSEPEEASAGGAEQEQHHQHKQEAQPAEKRNGEHHQPEPSHHHHEEEHHHEHPPEAFEIHHKKGGKSFQYFHQGHGH